MWEVKLILEARDIVGESLVYDDRRDAVVWVDIVGRRIHRFWLADQRHEVWPTPDFPPPLGSTSTAMPSSAFAIVSLCGVSADLSKFWPSWSRISPTTV